MHIRWRIPQQKGALARASPLSKRALFTALDGVGLPREVSVNDEGERVVEADVGLGGVKEEAQVGQVPAVRAQVDVPGVLQLPAHRVEAHQE